MHRWVAVAVVAALVMAAGCSDDTRPSAGASNSGRAVSSGSDLVRAQSLARTLADGLEQGSSGRITSQQADCLVSDVARTVRADDLADIASADPDPRSVPTAVRQALAAAFAHCLPSDVASELTKRLGL